MRDGATAVPTGASALNRVRRGGWSRSLPPPNIKKTDLYLCRNFKDPGGLHFLGDFFLGRGYIWGGNEPPPPPHVGDLSQVQPNPKGKPG